MCLPDQEGPPLDNTKTKTLLKILYLMSLKRYSGNRKRNRNLIHGSPKVALDIQSPFTEYIFIEKDNQRSSELEALLNDYGNGRKITILPGDANEQLQEYVLKSKRYNWKECRALAFIDPFGMQVPWNTIYGLGQTKAIEIILNLPVGMAIQRLLPKSGQFTEDQKKMLTEYFGSEDWENIVYEDQTGLLANKG